MNSRRQRNSVLRAQDSKILGSSALAHAKMANIPFKVQDTLLLLALALPTMKKEDQCLFRSQRQHIPQWRII